MISFLKKENEILGTAASFVRTKKRRRTFNGVQRSSCDPYDPSEYTESRPGEADRYDDPEDPLPLPTVLTPPIRIASRSELALSISASKAALVLSSRAPWCPAWPGLSTPFRWRWIRW